MFYCVASAAHFLFWGEGYMKESNYREMFFILYNAITDALQAPTKTISDKILSEARNEALQDNTEKTEDV